MIIALVVGDFFGFVFPRPHAYVFCVTLQFFSCAGKGEEENF